MLKLISTPFKSIHNYLKVNNTNSTKRTIHVMAGYNIEVVKGAPINLLGEGPHWNSEKQELIYVDIPGQAVYRHVPGTGENRKVSLDSKVSLVCPVENHPTKYLITQGREIQVMEWDGISSKPGSIKMLYTVDDHLKANSFNDGKCDALGRLWAGTWRFDPSTMKVDPKKGTLYSFDSNGKVEGHFGDIDVANGLAWTSDNQTFYYIDSMSYKVDAFDFDLEKGTLSNRRTVYDFKADGVEGHPDGMTIDSNGNLWIAMFSGKKVVHIDPKAGTKIDQIDMPTSNITSVAFGGPNLDILYVTSAERHLSKEQKATEPTAGSLFQVTNIGAKGAAKMFSYKGPI